MKSAHLFLSEAFSSAPGGLASAPRGFCCSGGKTGTRGLNFTFCFVAAFATGR